MGRRRITRGTMIYGAAYFAILAIGLALLACFRLLRRRRLDQSRSVLIHAPAPQIWEVVRHFPTLHGRFGKARGFGAAQEFLLGAGDGETEGSIWRVMGHWGSAPYWAEVQIVRFKPHEAIGIRLLRDSLGTHRSLLDHLGVLTLETIDPGTTKLSWRLRARLRGRGLFSARLLSGDRLAARLLDQGLRSMKMTLESSVRRARETIGDAPRADAHLPAETARPIPIQGAQQPDPGRREAPPRDSRPRGPAEPTV